MYIITFQNTISAILAEKAFRQASFHVKVMPVPSRMREGCGIALRVMDYKEGMLILNNSNINFSAIYAAKEYSKGMKYIKVIDK